MYAAPRYPFPYPAYAAYPAYRSPRQPKVVSSAFGDVNGDGVPDYVFLTAEAAEQGSNYLHNITVNIQCGATRRMYTIPLDANANSGYNPTVFLGDFTGDGIRDILVSIDSGGSGALTFDYIFSFVNNTARKLFDFNTYNEQNKYTVQFLDGYKVKVHSPATKTDFIIDISGRDSDYLSQLYTAGGKLRRPMSGSYNGVSGFYPVDMDRDGVYEVQAFQRITGLYNADSLGYVINTLKWNGRQLDIWQQWLAIFGTAVG